MNHFYSKTLFIIFCYSMLTVYSQSSLPDNKKLPHMLIIMGSVRDERSSEKIARAVYDLIDTSKLSAQIIDLKEYAIPIIDFEMNFPNDKRTKNWSKIITSSDAIIFLIPNYNEGYPGVLKNAIDSITYQWKDKIIGLIAYSGGHDGGKLPIDSLLATLKTLQMKVLTGSTVYIPFASTAVNFEDKFKKQKTKDEVENLLKHIIKSI